MLLASMLHKNAQTEIFKIKYIIQLNLKNWHFLQLRTSLIAWKAQNQYLFKMFNPLSCFKVLVAFMLHKNAETELFKIKYIIQLNLKNWHFLQLRTSLIAWKVQNQYLFKVFNPLSCFKVSVASMLHKKAQSEGFKIKYVIWQNLKIRHFLKLGTCLIAQKVQNQYLFKVFNALSCFKVLVAFMLHKKAQSEGFEIKYVIWQNLKIQHFLKLEASLIAWKVQNQYLFKVFKP